MKGDALASGAIRASFQMPKVSQEKWDDIFGSKSTKRVRSSKGKSLSVGPNGAASAGQESRAE